MKKKIYLLLILVLAFLLRLPFFSVPLDHDEGTYAFFAFFSKQDKFYPPLPIGRLPGIIFTYRFLDDLFPGQIAFFRMAAALLVVLATFGIYQLGKLLFGKKIGLFSALIFALFSSQISRDSAANTEFFMMPLTVLAFLLFWLFQKSKKRFWLVLAGLLAGLAVFYKQVAVFEIALLILWLAKSKPFLKQGFIFGIAFLTPILASLFFFLARGELADFWWQSFASSSQYGTNAWQGGEWLVRLWTTFNFLKNDLWFFWFLGLMGLIILFIRPQKERTFLLLWLIFSSLGAACSGWFFPHHFVQLIPVLSLLGGIFMSQTYQWAKIHRFYQLGIILAVFFLMVKNQLPYHFGYLQMMRGKMTRIEYLEKIGFDVIEAGWLPFYQSADYLKAKMRKEDSLFVWSTTPLPYYLTRKYPTTSFVYSYPLLDYQFMLATYQGWQFDFEGNRQQLMRELNKPPPDYLLIDVNPEQTFDQLFLFKKFSQFVTQNYELEEQFGHLLIFKIKKEQEIKEAELSLIPLELVKRFSAITEIEEKNGQTEVTFEPMVNPKGILRSFKVTYPEVVKINFEPLSVQFLGQDGHDFVGNGSSKPSGVIDLHLRVKGSAKPVSFVRVKRDKGTWNNRHYGVNVWLKVIQNNDIFDLYFEPLLDWQNQEHEVYFIYQDGTLSHTTIFWQPNQYSLPAG